MALAENNFNEIKNRVLEAYQNEDPLLQKFREYAKRIKNDVKPIRPYSVNAVSFVSSDGGDNRLYFNPAVIELVRVVDSRGNQCALDAIAGNTNSKAFNERAQAGSNVVVEPLRKLCDDLGMKVLDLSYLLESIDKPGKSTGAIRTYRDIVEWAVLYDLIKYREWGSDTIIIREGMLRTKSFELTVFPLIDEQIRAACEKHKKERNINVSIVGVAKQSAVLTKLTVALELEEALHKDFPCYVKVPYDVEEHCYNFDGTWLETASTKERSKDGKMRYQSFGNLYLVKFGDRPFDPVWPVDIAEWQVNDAERILGQLQFDARPGFPIPDFPMSVQKAHDFAKVNGLEVDILQDILFEGITQKLTPAEKEKVLRMKHLGQNLTNIRYKNA
jgi:hypothetical protein